MSNTSRNRRKRYIVLKRFQLRFIGTILFFILLTAFVTSIIMFKSMGAYLREALSNVYPQTEIVRIMRAVTIRIWLGVAVISVISVFFGELAAISPRPNNSAFFSVFWTLLLRTG